MVNNELRFIYIAFIVIILLSCNSDKPVQKRNNEITKICFATGGCYGKCRIFAIEIDSTLTFKFHGVENIDKVGYYTGKVSQGFWDTLNMVYERINYKQLDTSYQHSVDDISTETILYYNGNRKHIWAQDASLPDSIKKSFLWIMDSYKIIPLVKSDSISFETRYQIPPPILKMQQFTPPPIH